MKTIYRLLALASLAAVSGASGCGSCGDDGSNSNSNQAPTITCGSGTINQGGTCVPVTPIRDGTTSTNAK